MCAVVPRAYLLLLYVGKIVSVDAVKDPTKSYHLLPITTLHTIVMLYQVMVLSALAFVGSPGIV